MNNEEPVEIRGYRYGTDYVTASRVTMEELRQLEEAVGWTREDAKWLRVAGDTLVPRAEEMVDCWRGTIRETPQLFAAFLKSDGLPDDHYRAAVKRRFVQWVSDVCLRDHDQAWLDYQDEIGRRHTPSGKNETDRANTPANVPLRYLLGFTAVVITSVRGFLSASSRTAAELTKMEDAWARAVLLSVTLWTRAYSLEGLW